MSINVTTLADGRFAVVDDGGHPLAEPFETHAQAWATVDALLGDRIPKRVRKKVFAKNGRSKGKAKLDRKTSIAANKAPGWLRTIGAAKFSPAERRVFRDYKLGTFGPASEVRRIDPAEYRHLEGARK